MENDAIFCEMPHATLRLRANYLSAFKADNKHLAHQLKTLCKSSHWAVYYSEEDDYSLANT